MPKFISTILILTIAAFLALVLVRGQMGLYNKLHFQYDYDIVRGGPFEASNSNSRYALTQAIVENGSLFFTPEQAQFASPDLVYFNNKYFSIFTPGVSFFGVLFYMAGVLLGIPQLLTYLSTILLAILNLYLVYKISEKLGMGHFTSLFCGLVFLFTTDAIAYSLTYTQHHLSTALILLGVLNALSARTWINNISFGIIFGLSLLADIPNGLMLLPVLGYVLFKNFVVLNNENKTGFMINWKIIGLLLGVIPLVITFALYNLSLTGSYTTLGQSIGRTEYEKTIEPVPSEEKDTSENSGFNSPLDFEDIPYGSYILLLSNERGWLFYSPLMFLGLFGIYLLSKKEKAAGMILGVIAADVLVYSMFGDPHGGWAFGPRYLIPGAALASVGVGLAIKNYKNKTVFNFLVVTLMIYGLVVNVLGAMTTNNIPPKEEAIHLQNPIPYTYELNWQLLGDDESSSLFYDIYLSDKMTAKTFYLTYLTVAGALLTGFYLIGIRPEKNITYNNA